MTTLADVLEFKELEGWALDGDTITHWNAAEAGRGRPTAAEIATWRAEYAAQDGDAVREDARKGRMADDLDPLLRAFILALNDGSFVPGSRYTGPQIKAIMKAKL